MPKEQITHIPLKHGQMMQRTDESSYQGHHWSQIDHRFIGFLYTKAHKFEVRRPVKFTVKKATPQAPTHRVTEVDGQRYMLLKKGDVLCGGDEGYCLHHLAWKPIAPIFIGSVYDQVPASVMRRPMPEETPLKEKMVFFDGEQQASITVTFSKPKTQ